jgi:hypothetical protein
MDTTVVAGIIGKAIIGTGNMLGAATTGTEEAIGTVDTLGAADIIVTTAPASRSAL